MYIYIMYKYIMCIYIYNVYNIVITYFYSMYTASILKGVARCGDLATGASCYLRWAVALHSKNKHDNSEHDLTE